MTDVSAETGSIPSVHVPTITAEVRDDGTGELVVDGVLETIARTDLAEAGAEVTARVAALAARLGAPLPMQVRDPDGMWELLVHPDGRVDQAAEDEVAVAPPSRFSQKPVSKEAGFFIPLQFTGEGDRTNAQREMWWWGFLLT